MPGSSGKEQGIPPAQAKPDADKCISAESHKRQTASSGTDTESGMFSVFVFCFIRRGRSMNQKHFAWMRTFAKKNHAAREEL